MHRNEKQEPKETPHGRAGDRRPRKRAWIAAALLVATAAAGSAARWTTPLHPVDPHGGGGVAGALDFRAPGGGPVHFEGRLDRGSILAGGEGLVKMELVLRGDERPALERQRVPTDLVVVLDRSGSMQGEPLAQAKAAVRELIGRLDPQDRFSLVTYASAGAVHIPLTRADRETKDFWHRELGSVHARGGTNMAHGIDLAVAAVMGARERGRAPRVIVLSDGHANEGDHSLEGLRARAGRAVSGEFVLSAVGVGLGFDENVMSSLADAGTGNFYYVRDGSALGEVFAGEFESARDTMARGLAIRIDPKPGVEVVDAAGYPLVLEDGAVWVRPGNLFAGQERRIWVTLRAPVPTETESVSLGEFALTWTATDDSVHELSFEEAPQVAVVAAERDFLASVDEEAFESQLVTDGLNALKQGVASMVQAGKPDAALMMIQSFEDENRSYYRHWKKDEKRSRAYLEADELREQVGEAFAPSAPAAARNDLGKTLSSDGIDGRRVGAKRK